MLDGLWTDVDILLYKVTGRSPRYTMIKITLTVDTGGFSKSNTICTRWTKRKTSQGILRSIINTTYLHKNLLGFPSSQEEMVRK